MDVYRYGCSALAVSVQELTPRICLPTGILVNNSDSRFLFVENDQQFDKFLQAG